MFLFTSTAYFFRKDSQIKRIFSANMHINVHEHFGHIHTLSNFFKATQIYICTKNPNGNVIDSEPIQKPNLEPNISIKFDCKPIQSFRFKKKQFSKLHPATGFQFCLKSSDLCYFFVFGIKFHFQNLILRKYY